MGLLDVLQSASNAVAGNVAGPVDLLSFALRKAGIPIPEDALGGSEWMKRKGLMRDVPHGAEQVVGETLGLLAPTAIAANAPKIARGLLQAQANAAAPKTLHPETGAIVWHGSPHKFDKFDSSKMGTGEGAQAYGAGSYLAEARATGEEYQKRLSKNVSVDGKKLQTVPSDGPVAQAHNTIVTRIQNGMPPEQAIAAAVKYWEDAASEMLGFLKTNPKLAERIEAEAASRLAVAQEARKLNPSSFHLDPGYLYKVDLPDEFIPRMLDWDKPLGQQPEGVRKALSVLDPYVTSSGGKMWGELAHPGFASTPTESPRAAADWLRQQGIPGIRYLDGSSRGAGKGSYNYVVFPGLEDQLKILERNGVPLGLLTP